METVYIMEASVSAATAGMVERLIAHTVSSRPLSVSLVPWLWHFNILFPARRLVFLGECPYGVAWADKAYAVNSAHQEVPCSNAGVCNPFSGECECFDGFEGSACQRSEFLSFYAFILFGGHIFSLLVYVCVSVSR
jgi:hypothetical protein